MSSEYRNDVEDESAAEYDEQIQFLDKKQRELVTSTVDYNLDTLAQLIKQRVIDLEPKYQRRFRWDDVRKSRLIESFLMNVPIPPIFLNEDNYGKYSVIDGKQRLSAISQFLSGDLRLKGLAVFSDLNSATIYDLPNEFQNSLRIRANVRAIIILRQSDKNLKYEVFQRLNTGGVKLNAQEIRNSAFPGPLNDKILELSESKAFHKMLGIRSKPKSRIYQEMKDAELVLRFFALKDDWYDYAGGMKTILDRYLEEHKDMDSVAIQVLAGEFRETIDTVAAIFGEDGSFRRWLPQNNKWKQQVSAPLFDAQMFSCYGKDRQLLTLKRDIIMREFKELFAPSREDWKFLESIESSTGSPERFQYRVERLESIITSS